MDNEVNAPTIKEEDIEIIAREVARIQTWTSRQAREEFEQYYHPQAPHSHYTKKRIIL